MNIYDETEDRRLLEPNAYTLFLILILLILGTNSDFEERLSHISSVIRASHNAVKMMRAGINEFHSSMVNGSDTNRVG